MFTMFLSVAAGGALGASLRFFIGIMFAERWGLPHWAATVSVNILGCLSMGLCAGYIAHHSLLPDSLRGFIMVGFLGALTTFSSFALDIHILVERSGFISSFMYLSGTVIASIAVFLAGLWVMRWAAGAV